MTLFLASLAWTGGAYAADPALANQWITYGQKLYAAQQYDQAIKAFSTAARANGSDPKAWSGLGNSLYAKKDYKNALTYYKYALQLDPKNAALATFVQRLEGAVAQNGAAPQSDPTTMGNQYYKAGQYDNAIVQYKTAVAANPNNAKAYQGLGNCYYAKQDKPDAVAAYKHALQADPSNTQQLKAFLARYSPADAQASGVQVASQPGDWTQPLWRSAILPGWGQFYNGERTKGWIIGGLTIAALLGTVTTYTIGDSARSAYRSAGAGTSQSTFDSDYNTWNTMATYNHVFCITFLALYIFNLVDAAKDAPATQAVGLLDDGTQPPLQLGLLDNNGTWGAKVRVLQF
jgi:tetratricopeptide (TPR) repeat protein